MDDFPEGLEISGLQSTAINQWGTKMKNIKLSDLLVLLPMLLLGWGSAVADKSRGAANSPEVNLRILAINDFHGNIATSSGSFGGTGRADFLSTNIQAAEAGADNSIFVSAGDLIGASPLISALCVCNLAAAILSTVIWTVTRSWEPISSFWQQTSSTT
jgi:2',3'-cyclic-nucleotide 2'-phosphodiesterase (5'-nucleotidase family)